MESINQKSFYTYIYWNPVKDRPFYVGKGKNNRANTHIKGTSTNKQVRGYICNLRKQDIQPIIEIIHTTNELAAHWLERCFIAAYGRKDKNTGCFFNHTDGGEGSAGRIDMIGENNPMYKKHHTRETLDLLSQQKLGEKHPFYGKKRPEHSNKMKEKMIGNKNASGYFWITNGINETHCRNNIEIPEGWYRGRTICRK